jgi:predicted transcriptional regulator
MSIEYDTNQKGLSAVLKDYQEIAMKTLWKSKEGLNSRNVWIAVNEKLSPETISRASIINFLEYMRKTEVLNGVEETGKGGHHWVYTPAMDESGYKQHIAETLINALIKEFPDETRKAIRNL